MYRVTMVACVAGNPHKAWKVPIPDDWTDEQRAAHAEQHPNAPTRLPPDDEWEEQIYPFDDLDTAKRYISGLDPVVTTHVRLEYLEPGERDEDGSWVTIFDQDADGDHLDDAAPGVPMPHTVTSKVATDAEEVPDAPTPMPAQAGAQ